MPKSRILNVAYMYFNAIHENKILAKISEFTVEFRKKKQQAHNLGTMYQHHDVTSTLWYFAKSTLRQACGSLLLSLETVNVVQSVA